MRLRVRGGNVAIRPIAQPTISGAGLHLVYDRQASTVRGTVIALGEGPASLNGAHRLSHSVAVGDAVIFSPDCGEELSFEQDTIIILPEADILAVIDS